jgi:hypothetical protein
MAIRTFTTRLSPRCAPPKDAGIAACPHIVEQPKLSRETLGDDGFEEALREKRHWLAENCFSDHVAEPLRSEGVIQPHET